jgi:hypothetical protein
MCIAMNPAKNSTQTQFCENHSMIFSSAKLHCRLAVSLIDTVSSQRQVNESTTPVCREDLLDADRSVFKSQRAIGHIPPSHAMHRFAHVRKRFSLLPT